MISSTQIQTWFALTSKIQDLRKNLAAEQQNLNDFLLELKPEDVSEVDAMVREAQATQNAQNVAVQAAKTSDALTG